MESPPRGQRTTRWGLVAFGLSMVTGIGGIAVSMTPGFQDQNIANALYALAAILLVVSVGLVFEPQIWRVWQRRSVRAAPPTVDQSRPLLRLEPFVRRVRNPTYREPDWEACLLVVNEHPAVRVDDVSARILEWGPFALGEWNPAALRKLGADVGFRPSSLRRLEGQDGAFYTRTDFKVAETDGLDLCVLAVDEAVRYRTGTTSPGVFGLKIEVAASNLGAEPVVGWFRLTFGSGEDLLAFDAWSGPARAA